MFAYEDAAVFQLPDSYSKLDEIGNVYFSQLGALLGKANALIYEIYGIEVDARYKVSHDPTPIQQRRPDAEFKVSRNRADQATVGFRAKGVPVNLTKPNGEACQIHFAKLAFGIFVSRDGVRLAIGFEPYVLNYHQRHREEFATWIEVLDLSRLLDGMSYSFNFETTTIAELMRKHGARLIANHIPGISPSQTDLAELVITFAAMFPLLDVFTRLSGGEDVSNSKYWGNFEKWRAENGDEYVSDFSVEPIRPNISRSSEAQVRDYFESLLGRKFPTARPDWLRSDATGARLELDGYCEELALAFEYQGEYHYIYIPVHHQGRTLEEVEEIDALKKKLCQEHIVDLIQVPFTQKDNILFVVEALKNLKRLEIDRLLEKRDTWRHD